jgi:hypothetical protein
LLHGPLLARSDYGDNSAVVKLFIKKEVPVWGIELGLLDSETSTSPLHRSSKFDQPSIVALFDKTLRTCAGGFLKLPASGNYFLETRWKIIWSLENSK